MEIIKKSVKYVKLDITEVLKKIYGEENITEECYISIREMNTKERSLMIKYSAEMMTRQEIEKMAKGEILDEKNMMIERLSLPKGEYQKKIEAKDEYYEFCINAIVSKTEHNFTSGGKAIELDYKALAEMDNDQNSLMAYIIEEMNKRAAKKKGI